MTNTIKSFLSGMGSAIDLGGSPIKNPIKGTSDSERLRNDWYRVGNDMRKVIKDKTYDTRKK